MNMGCMHLTPSSPALSVPAHVEMMGLIGGGNNPMVGACRRGCRGIGGDEALAPFSALRLSRRWRDFGVDDKLSAHHGKVHGLGLLGYTCQGQFEEDAGYLPSARRPRR